MQCSHHREAGLVQTAFPIVESKFADKSRAPGTGARCLYAFFVRLAGDVEMTVRPGEVTSMQEFRAVSSLRMHSPECTVQQNQGNAASYQNSMINGQTGGYIDMGKYY